MNSRPAHSNGPKQPEISYDASLLWSIVRTELVTDRFPSPQEFVNKHLVLPYLLNSEQNPTREAKEFGVAKALAKKHGNNSYDAIMIYKEKLLEFQRISTASKHLLRDSKNHKFTKGFVESAGLTVDECVRFTTKLLAANQQYEEMRTQHKCSGRKLIHPPLLTSAEVTALKNVKDFFEETHEKLLTDNDLINEIVEKQMLFNGSKAGEPRREELETKDQVTEALGYYEDEYDETKDAIDEALKEDWKKAQNAKKKNQELFKDFVSAAAGPFVGPIAEKSLGILASLANAAAEHLLKRSESKLLTQMPLSAAEQKGSDLVSEAAAEAIRSRMFKKSFYLAATLESNKTQSRENFAKKVRKITELYYKNIYSEEWIRNTAIELRSERIKHYKKNKMFISQSELVKDINEGIKKRINEAIEFYDSKLKEIREKVITIEDDYPTIASANVISQIFALGYTCAGLEEFKDFDTFNKELPDFLDKIKNRAGSDNVIDHVRKSRWPKFSDIDSLGFMDDAALNHKLGISGNLHLFGQRFREITPGKSPKEKMIALNIDKRILTAIALVRIGEILKQTCGTLLPELVSPDEAAHAILQIARQGVEAPKFKEIFIIDFSSDAIEAEKNKLANQAVFNANVKLQVAEKNWHAAIGDKKESMKQYQKASKAYLAAHSTPLPSNKKVIKKLTTDFSGTKTYLQELRDTAKLAAKAALKAQEKTEKAKKQLDIKINHADALHDHYAEVSVTHLQSAQAAWEVEDKKASEQRTAFRKIEQEEARAKQLSEHAATEFFFRNKFVFKDTKESWLFKVFSEVPFLSKLVYDDEVRKHLSELITFDVALKNSLGDPAVQDFLDLKELKDEEFCTFLNLRTEFDYKNRAFNLLLEKIEVIRTFGFGLEEPLDDIRAILFSCKQFEFLNDTYPLDSLLAAVAAGSLLTTEQQDLISQLEEQIKAFEPDEHFFEFNLEDVSETERPVFYNFYQTLHVDSTSALHEQIDNLFNQYKDPMEVVDKFMEYFKDTVLVGHPELFKQIILCRHHKEMEISAAFHYRNC